MKKNLKNLPKKNFAAAASTARCKTCAASRERQQKAAAFTLVEIIIAVSVIGLVITAAAQLTQTSVKIAAASMRKLAATHLAAEGIEIIRNMRDSNWLRNEPWRKNLPDGKYEIVPNSESSYGDNGAWRLQRIYDEQSTAKIIEISSRGNAMRVESRVRYLQRGIANEIALEMEMMDWKKGPI